MKRKVLLITVLVLLMVFAAAPLMSLPASAEENAEEAEVEAADVQPAPMATIFTQDFESAGWPADWIRGDANSPSGYDYWGLYNAGYNSAKSAWCAGVSDHPYGAGRYDNNMGAYMYKFVSLSGYTGVKLSYRYWLSTQAGYDFLFVMYKVGSTWYYIDGHFGVYYSWLYSSVSIPNTATYVGFLFYSDADTVNNGAWVDHVQLTGTPIGYSIHVRAWCDTCGWIYMPITMDGTYTGYTTPHDFTGLTGKHTLTAPATDSAGHPFYEWSTGSTSRTITVSSGGTYTARFHAAAKPPTLEIWTNKGAYAKGQTLTAYVQLYNPGSARNVKVNVWFGLPGGGTYLYETYYLSLPASYTSPVYVWKSLAVPYSAAVGTYSVNAFLRDASTNTLLDSDIYYFTIS